MTIIIQVQNIHGRGKEINTAQPTIYYKY
uniref:Uncharacterized protein n=1 Tax=Arundo donax TaxID=35708 RepID=A0A0A8ZUU0_ARUDO